MKVRVAASPILLLAALLALGCGGDFQPATGTPTGEDPAPVGQKTDLVVELPGLSFPGEATRGLKLWLSLETEEGGSGTRDALVVYEDARIGGQSHEVDDVSPGKTRLTVGPDTWATGRIGPISVAGTSFEFSLRGASADGGWHVSGESWESQTGGSGPFTGWRRQRFLVVSTDFIAGGRVESIELVRGAELRHRGNLSAVSSDPVIRQSGRSAYAVNRLGFDNVQRLDPAEEFRTAWQAGVGQGSNPHDVIEVNGSLFVTRYEPPFDDLAVLSTTGGAFVASIPLESLAENRDATPRADRIAAAGGRLFVGLHDIDRSFSRYADGKLAVVDPGSRTLEQGITLPGKNPGVIVTLTEEGREKLFVALAGIFPGLLPQELSGGVAVVDVQNRVFERWALDDDTAGGNVLALAMVSTELGYVIVSDAQYQSHVLAFDPVTGTVLRTLQSTSSFLPELALGAGGTLAIPDRSFAAPGVCLWAVPAVPSEAERQLGCIRTSLPPSSVVALD